jgi:hypothetical protein
VCHRAGTDGIITLVFDAAQNLDIKGIGVG